jgi:hypothetical protein
MSEIINQQENQSEVVSNKENKHFVDDELFQKLLAIREEIYQATEINVSPRKLVNMLLKRSDFEALRDQLIQQYQ